MSEFIEITEVGARRGVEGERITKDLRKFVINKDQVACLIPSERAAGCTEVVMSNGKLILVRGTPEQITGQKPGTIQLVEKVGPTPELSKPQKPFRPGYVEEGSPSKPKKARKSKKWGA